MQLTHTAPRPCSESVLFGYMDRSVRVSQEAYAIFLDRERALEAQVAALSQQAEPECEWPTCECALEPERCKQAEPAPAAVPDSSDTFYAGLYKKSAPMWHRLHDLAVSKGYDHVRFAIECAPVYRCDCMGARKVAIDMAGNTIPCECVAAANEAEPVRCEYCDGTGDVHRADGEWLGECKECDAAEPAPAQDERWAVHAQGPDELYAAFSREDAEQHAAALNTLSMPAGIQVSAIVVESPWPAAEHWKYLAEQERDHVAELRARVTRPTQTEQQPVAWRWMYNGESDGPYAFNYPLPDDDVVRRGLMAARPRTVQPLYAAPIEQTEQQPIQVTAVAVMRDDGDGGLEPDWLLEGGTAELMAGMVLVVAEGDITGDDGHGEVYAAPIAQTAPQPSKAIAYRTLDRYGNPVTDWIDGDPAGGDPIVSGGSFQLAYGAPQPERSGWIGVEDRLPEVAAGDEGEFIVCVYRSHNGESYSFSARFLNDYPLQTDYEDEPALHSGWYDAKEHADYDGWYSPLIDEKSGDKVTHWMPLPSAPALSTQGAIWERLP